MNKGELVKKVATEMGVTEKKVNVILTNLMEVIVETVASGESVTLVGFGTFEARSRKEREGRNPRTGELLAIPATVVPAFSPGKTFKDAVKQGVDGKDSEIESAA